MGTDGGKRTERLLRTMHKLIKCIGYQLELKFSQNTHKKGVYVCVYRV